MTDPTGEAAWARVVSTYDGDGALINQFVVNRDGSAIRSGDCKRGSTILWTWQENYRDGDPTGEMTTAVQVRRAVKPLLQRHSDLALVDGWIVLKPVRHLVRAVLIDRTSRADDFKVKWCVMHVFEVRCSIFLNWGQELYFPS